MEKVWLLVAVAASVLARVAAVELTFELPDNAKECFYEEIEKGTECTLEYQVGQEDSVRGRGRGEGRED